MIQILWGRSSTYPDAGRGLLTVDAALSQTDNYKNKISAYPVEVGLDITDHIRQEPDEFTMDGIISDTPDDYFVLDSSSICKTAYKALCMIAGRDFVVNETAFIKNEYPQPILVDIIAKYRVFTDMICESLSFPRTPTTGDTISFSAHFKKIRKASLTLATINYTTSRGNYDQAQSSVDNGKQPTSETVDPVKKALTSASDTFKAWFNGEQTTSQALGF